MICNRCKVDKSEDKFIHGKLKCKECYNKCREYYKTHREQEIRRAQKSNRNKDRDIENEKKRERRKKNPVSYILMGAKGRAKKRGIPFDITHKDIVVPDVCPILGIPLCMANGSASGNSPSLDRIKPEYGYIKGNVQVISHRANTIKSDSTLDELRAIVRYLENQELPPIEGELFTKLSRDANKKAPWA